MLTFMKVYCNQHHFQSIALCSHAAAPSLPPPTSKGGLSIPGLGPADPRDWLSQPHGQADIPNPGLSWALTDAGRQLIYPAWLVGTW